MAILSRKNQYKGINAHYQSVAQNEFNGWRPFHSTHIIDLMRYIQARLPLGYEIEPEDSLRLHDTRRYTVPDLLVWNVDQERAPQQAETQLQEATLVREIEETISDEESLPNLVIREMRRGREATPVTRIEVLSPANKDREGRDIYFSLRRAAIQSHISVIELDYLHETDSPIPTVPGYATRQKNAYPYMITVADVRPHVKKFLGYGFDVDESLFSIEVPLAHEESIQVDFGEVYTYSLENVIAFTHRIDYTKEPVNFHTYTPSDRKRIWGVMLSVLDAERTGKDLNRERVISNPYDPALQALENYHFLKAALLIDEKTLAAYWLMHQQNHELLLLKRTLEDGEIKLNMSKLADGTEEDYKTLKTKFEQTGSFTD